MLRAAHAALDDRRPIRPLMVLAYTLLNEAHLTAARRLLRRGAPRPWRLSRRRHGRGRLNWVVQSLNFLSKKYSETSNAEPRFLNQKFLNRRATCTVKVAPV